MSIAILELPESCLECPYRIPSNGHVPDKCYVFKGDCFGDRPNEACCNSRKAAEALKPSHILLEKLTRYDAVICDCVLGKHVETVACLDGDMVKFNDIKEILNLPYDTARNEILICEYTEHCTHKVWSFDLDKYACGCRQYKTSPVT